MIAARKPRGVVLALLLLAGFGVVRLPLESALTRELKRLHFLGGELRLEMREEMSQGMFAAVLGGFRSLVASMLHLQAYTAWENIQWGRIEGLYSLITRLQPRMASYWDAAHWQMAYNAASFYRYSSQATPALRRQLYDSYVEKGRKFLEDGIRNNPDDYQLTAQMAELYRRRIGDPCRAAEFYGRTADNPRAPAYYRRFEAYWLAQCPGREAEALDLLRRLYHDGPRNHKPSLFLWLHRMQEALAVPEVERIEIPEAFRRSSPADGHPPPSPELPEPSGGRPEGAG